ncbi:Methyltransferase-like protein 16 [Actinomortierella wolfii]|nr:Methyltransferase-like protein 16 [Actinomortierella wolfii]
MCNPPFFEDDDDYLTSLSFKQDAPAAALQATDSELKTSGGEVEFIKRMIDESRILQTRIRWYTTMIGKKSTVKTIISYLRQYSIHNFTVTTFRQGRTFRWAIAWSYHPEHAPKVTRNSISTLATRGTSFKHQLTADITFLTFMDAKSTWTSLSKDLQTLKQVMSFSLPDRDPEKIFSSIESILELLDISVQTVHDGAEDVSCAHIIQGEAFSHSWSRAARRAKARQAQAKEQSHTSLPVSPTTTIVRSEGQEPVLGFELQVRADAQPPFEHATKKQRVESSQNDADKNKITETVTVEVSWLVGKDRELFESFVKHLRSRLEAEKN